MSLAPASSTQASARPEPASPKLGSIEFDPYGDVKFCLSSASGIAKFRVNSNVLCLASPVFRAMLGANSRFKEGVALASRNATSEPLEISLQDDDPNALAIILRVIHLQGDLVPLSLNEDQLYLVAVLCDKYDMRQALELRLETWLAPLLAKTVTGDKWLFMAYAFGRKAEFSRLSEEMILNCQADKDGTLLTADGKAISVHIPGHVVAEISARRQHVIESMIACIHSVIKKYADPEQAKCNKGKQCCNDLNLGFLVRTFIQLRFYPEASYIATQAIGESKRLLDLVTLPADLTLMERGHGFYGRCRTCGQTPINSATDHGTTCSPILAYSGQIKELFDGIHGLDYANFVREVTSPKQAAAPQAGTDLWDCIEYQ